MDRETRAVTGPGTASVSATLPDLAVDDRRRGPGRRRRFARQFEDLLDRKRTAESLGAYPLFPRIDAHLGDGWVSIDGHRAVSLIANDYLGLSADPDVSAAAVKVVERLGTSRCSSPLVGGYTATHQELEAALCDFLQQAAAAVFASGYQANVGTISSLMGPGDLIVADLLDHASIVDGAKLSGAELRFFRHNDPVDLGRILEDVEPDRRVLVVVEGIYSADGDIGALREVCEVAHARDALVMVDEAHSLGVLGDRGAGAAEQFGLLGEVDLVMGTMSKSLGSIGGFVVGDTALIDAVRHDARALVFSASLSPPNAAAARAALAILRERPGLRERLWDNARTMLSGLDERGFDTLGSCTPVIPVLVGDPTRTLAFTAALREAGVLVCPAIPPMVHAHLSRIRMHVTAGHGAEALEHALATLDSVAAELGLRRKPIEAAREGAGPSALSVKATVRRLIAETAAIPPELIDDDASFDGELAMDSLTVVSLQVELERAFGVDCPVEELREMRRFDEVVSAIESKLERCAV